MSSRITELVDKVAERLRRYDNEVGAPAPWPAIVRAELWVRDRYAVPLPEALSELWGRSDGIYFNGMMIYRATEDEQAPYRYALRDTNEVYGEVRGKRYLFIGEADMDAFVHDTVAGGWHMADRITLDSFERFDSCQALLEAVLEKYLNM